MRTIQKILIEESTGKKFYVKDLDEDFHTSFGIIAKENLKGKESSFFSSKRKKFIAFAPSFVDFWESIERGPQALRQKDIGIIFAKTGINSATKIVDAGGGSGALCFALANLCKEITVYEINPQHYPLLEKNILHLALKNVILKKKNVYEGIGEKDVDVITLDLPEPWNVVPHAEKSLKVGGFLVVYVPNLTQVKNFIESTKGTSIKILETLELLERKWKIEDKIMRPEFEMLGHTGFLTFCRKM